MTINLGIPQIIWLVLVVFWVNLRDYQPRQTTRATQCLHLRD